MCAIIIGFATTGVSVQADTSREDVEMQLKSISSLLMIAEAQPQYKNQIVELVQNALAQLLIDVKKLDVMSSVKVKIEDVKVTGTVKKDKNDNKEKVVVSTSGEVVVVDGDDNDYANFEIEFPISSFGTTNYISEM